METLFQISIPLAESQFLNPVIEMLSKELNLAKPPEPSKFLVVPSLDSRQIQIRFWARDIYNIHRQLAEISTNLNVWPSNFEPVFEWGFPETHQDVERAFQFFTGPCSTLKLLVIAYELMLPIWINQGMPQIMAIPNSDSFAQSYPFVVNKFSNFINFLMSENQCYIESHYLRTAEFIRRFTRLIGIPPELTQGPLDEFQQITTQWLPYVESERTLTYPNWMVQLIISILIVLAIMVTDTYSIRLMPPQRSEDFEWWRTYGKAYAASVVREVAHLYAASQTGLDYLGWEFGIREYDPEEDEERITTYADQRTPEIHVHHFLRMWWIEVIETFASLTPEMMS